MESPPISSRLPEPLVRAARESAKRKGREGRKSDEELREEFRRARENAKGDSGARPEVTLAALDKVIGVDEAKDPEAKSDPVDARGRRLDIRV